MTCQRLGIGIITKSGCGHGMTGPQKAGKVWKTRWTETGNFTICITIFCFHLKLFKSCMVTSLVRSWREIPERPHQTFSIFKHCQVTETKQSRYIRLATWGKPITHVACGKYASNMYFCFQSRDQVEVGAACYMYCATGRLQNVVFVRFKTTTTPNRTCLLYGRASVPKWRKTGLERFRFVFYATTRGIFFAKNREGT